MNKKLLIVILLTISSFIVRIGNGKAIENNPLSKLEVETRQGQGVFDVSGTKDSFTFKLRSTNKYANIIATPKDSSYVVEGAGKVECQDGLNTIVVKVTDPKDNSSKSYTINLTFKHVENLDDTNGNPNTGSFLNIGLLGIAAIGTSYVLIKTKKNQKIKNI